MWISGTPRFLAMVRRVGGSRAHGLVCAVLHSILGAPGLQCVPSAYVLGAVAAWSAPLGPLGTHHAGSAITGFPWVSTVAEHLRLRRIVAGVVWKWSEWCPTGALFPWVGGVVAMSVGPRDRVVAGGVWKQSR